MLLSTMMKKLRGLGCVVSVVLFYVVCLVVFCNGDEQNLEVSPLMEKSQQEALYYAIQGFVGKQWNGSDLYPDPCGWTPIQGVSCDLFDGFWYVTDLSIGPVHDNSLECAQNAEFSPYLFTLKHLKTLSFYNCFASPHIRPISIASLNWGLLADSLESLEFRSNPGLVGQVPVSFGDLRKLQSLVLLDNGLSGDFPWNLGSLVSLKRLVLSGNGFSGRIPDNLGGFRDLLILDLSRNSLSGPLPTSIGMMSSLLKLDLSKNRLSGKIPEQIGGLKNTTLLDLSKNNLKGGLAKSLAKMCSLEELVVSDNPLGGTLMGVEWAHLRHTLTVLDLSNAELTGVIPESITSLERLRFLGLNDNNLSGGVPQRIAYLQNITTMYLNGNNLTGALKFSQGFYGKLGRRLGLWGNKNLCFHSGEDPTNTQNSPFGVQPCQHHEQKQQIGSIVIDTNSKLSNENENGKDFYSMVSLGFSSSRHNFGLWTTILAQVFVMIVVVGLDLALRMFGA